MQQHPFWDATTDGQIIDWFHSGRLGRMIYAVRTAANGIRLTSPTSAPAATSNEPGDKSKKRRFSAGRPHLATDLITDSFNTCTRHRCYRHFVIGRSARRRRPPCPKRSSYRCLLEGFHAWVGDMAKLVLESDSLSFGDHRIFHVCQKPVRGAPQSSNVFNNSFDKVRISGPR